MPNRTIAKSTGLTIISNSSLELTDFTFPSDIFFAELLAAPELFDVPEFPESAFFNKNKQPQ